MTTRILPREEYPRLAGTLLEKAWPYFNEQARVIVVERDGRIVRCAALFPEWRLDGVWTAESEKKSVGSGRRLLRTLRELARAMWIPEVVMMARSDEGRSICERVGVRHVRMNCDHYAVRMF